MNVLEIYTVNPIAPPPLGGEQVGYIAKHKLTNNVANEPFFDSGLDDALVNLLAERVLTIIGQPKEAEIAKQQALNIYTEYVPNN